MIDRFVNAVSSKDLSWRPTCIRHQTISALVDAISRGGLIGHCALIERDMLLGVHRLNLAQHQHEAIETTVEYASEVFGKTIPGKWAHLVLYSPHLLGLAASVIDKRNHPHVKSTIVLAQKQILNLCQAITVAIAARQIFRRDYSGFVVIACLVAAWAARNEWISPKAGDLLDESFGLISGAYTIYSGNLLDRSLATLRMVDQLWQRLPTHPKQDMQGVLEHGIDEIHLTAPKESSEPLTADFKQLEAWFAEWKRSVPQDELALKITQNDTKAKLGQEAQSAHYATHLLWKLAWEDKPWRENHSNQSTAELIDHVEIGLKNFVQRIEGKPQTDELRQKVAFAVQVMQNAEVPLSQLEKVFLFGLCQYHCPQGVRDETDGIHSMCMGELPVLSEDKQLAIARVLKSQRQYLFLSFVQQVYRAFSLRGVLPKAWLPEKEAPNFWLDFSLMQLFLGDRDDPHAEDLFKDLVGEDFFLHGIAHARAHLPFEHRSGPVWRTIWKLVWRMRGMNAVRQLREGYTKEALVTAIADLIKSEVTTAKQAQRDQWENWLKESGKFSGWHNCVELRASSVKKEQEDEEQYDLKQPYALLLAERELREAGILS